MHVTDRRRFPAFLDLPAADRARARGRTERRFAWRDPPYEYEHVKRPIDILCGTDRIRLAIESGTPLRRLAPGWKEDVRRFLRARRDFLLYR